MTCTKNYLLDVHWRPVPGGRGSSCRPDSQRDAREVRRVAVEVPPSHDRPQVCPLDGRPQRPGSAGRPAVGTRDKDLSQSSRGGGRRQAASRFRGGHGAPRAGWGQTHGGHDSLSLSARLSPGQRRLVLGELPAGWSPCADDGGQGAVRQAGLCDLPAGRPAVDPTIGQRNAGGIPDQRRTGQTRHSAGCGAGRPDRHVRRQRNHRRLLDGQTRL